MILFKKLTYTVISLNDVLNYAQGIVGCADGMKFIHNGPEVSLFLTDFYYFVVVKSDTLK